MFAEEDIVLISAIEHYSYCPRQFALMHVEQTFEDNSLTLSGNRVHENVDRAHVLRHEGVRVEYALPLWSDRLGLSGRADAVELHGDGTVWPVESKRGHRRPKKHDDLQLCAQALCLEEMLDVTVPRGSIYYHSSRRWREVLLSEPLRNETLASIDAIRGAMRSGVVPPPVNDVRCPKCSLIEVCQPELISSARVSTVNPANLEGDKGGGDA
ncbi:MAG: CRISPR-associated protein Cas4 [Coriobacteriia bacterium]|nr:CRISPR-associated protein Cas4 [Coriobacteriia bacterium]